FGLIPEFIGRLPVIASVSNLDEEALVRVLTEPRNSLLRQYQRLFEMDGVELLIDDAALHAIAAKAIERKTGARGLRGIMEEILVPVMFDVPERDDSAQLIAHTVCVRAGADPELGTAEPGERSAYPAGPARLVPRTSPPPSPRGVRRRAFFCVGTALSAGAVRRYCRSSSYMS